MRKSNNPVTLPIVSNKQVRSAVLAKDTNTLQRGEDSFPTNKEGEVTAVCFTCWNSSALLGLDNVQCHAPCNHATCKQSHIINLSSSKSVKMSKSLQKHIKVDLLINHQELTRHAKYVDKSAKIKSVQQSRNVLKMPCPCISSDAVCWSRYTLRHHGCTMTWQLTKAHISAPLLSWDWVSQRQKRAKRSSIGKHRHPCIMQSFINQIQIHLPLILPCHTICLIKQKMHHSNHKQCRKFIQSNRHHSHKLRKHKTQNKFRWTPRHNYPKSLLQQTFCSTHEHEPTKKDGSLSVFKYMLLLALLVVVLSSCDTSEPSYTKQSFMNAKEHSNTETLFQRNAEAFSLRKLHSQTNS